MKHEKIVLRNEKAGSGSTSSQTEPSSLRALALKHKYYHNKVLLHYFRQTTFGLVKGKKIIYTAILPCITPRGCYLGSEK